MFTITVELTTEKGTIVIETDQLKPSVTPRLISQIWSVILTVVVKKR